MSIARGHAGLTVTTVVYLLGLASAAGATLSELRGVSASLARIEEFNATILIRVEALEVWRAAHVYAGARLERFDGAAD
jgi:hypothetical protein